MDLKETAKKRWEADKARYKMWNTGDHFIYLKGFYAGVDAGIESGTPAARSDRCPKCGNNENPGYYCQKCGEHLGEKEPGWISVKDRLPKNAAFFLCYHPDWTIEVLWFNQSLQGFTYIGASTDFPTHWTPLPKAPHKE